MEGKQLLNINQPLLSVRRFSSIAASQRNETRKNETCLQNSTFIESYKTESKTDPTKNPGSIPFVWEQSPGKPKNETNKQIHPTETPPSIIPKLPPGRILNPKKKDSDKTPELNVSVENDDDDDDDDDDDEAYMDALDTLSRGESFFYNCSASGVSGLESNVKPSGIFSADPKVRDFMMGRFLPAAKAMTSEVPQHKKPREVKKLVKMDNQKLQIRYGPNFLQDLDHDNEEDDYDSNERGNISSKLCRLLPRFCLKGSLGLVNPVPGLCMRTKLPISSAYRIHTTSSSASSFSETENEPARMAIYEHRSFGRSHLAKHQEDENNSSTESFRSYASERNHSSSQDPIVEKTLYVDTVRMVKSPKANSVSYNTDTPKSLHFSCESLESNTLDHESKQETRKGFWKDPEVDDDMNDDQDLEGSRSLLFELPTPPPLPKSPSDSWLWRTLPKHQKSDKNIQLRFSQGPLLPIPET